MSQYDSTLPTRAGQAMLIEMLSTSKALHFTKVALGDGVKKENQANETMTALISEKLIGEMVKKTPQRDGSVKLEVKISNDGLQEGFFSRELGVWGKVGEDGEEQLILYTYATNASYIPSSEQLDEKIIRVFIAVGGATNIKIEVPRHGVVTVDMLEDHNNDVNAHDGAISKGISEHNASKTAHSAAFAEHNKSTSAHKPILDAIKAITGTPAFNTAPSKSIVEIINLLGMGGIVAAKLDANAGFVKYANGYTAMWGFARYDSLPNEQIIVPPIRAKMFGAVASDIGYTPGTGGTSVQIGVKDTYNLAFRPVYPTLNNTPFTNGTIHFWFGIGVAV